MRRIKIDLKIGFESLDIDARDEVTSNYLGRYKSIFKGKGLEFDSYRQFAPDDDASMIDRLASARAGTHMVRQFVEERNLNVFFLIDVSNTMILGSEPKLKCEYAAELISSLSYTILHAGDNIGFAMFNDDVIDYILPKKGISIHSQLLDRLTQAANYGGGYNLTKGVNFALEALEKGTLFIIVSDFIGLYKGWEEAIKLASSKFSVIGLMVRDPIDRSIPLGTGQIAISDPLTDEKMLIDPNLIKPYYEQEVKRMEGYITSVFRDNGCDLLLLQTDKPFIGKIIELFKMRQRKWK